MKVLRNLIYREVIQAVLYVSLAFLALFFFLIWSMRCAGWVAAMQATPPRARCCS